MTTRVWHSLDIHLCLEAMVFGFVKQHCYSNRNIAAVELNNFLTLKKICQTCLNFPQLVKIAKYIWNSVEKNAQLHVHLRVLREKCFYFCNKQVITPNKNKIYPGLTSPKLHKYFEFPNLKRPKIAKEPLQLWKELKLRRDFSISNVLSWEEARQVLSLLLTS